MKSGFAKRKIWKNRNSSKSICMFSKAVRGTKLLLFGFEYMQFGLIGFNYSVWFFLFVCFHDVTEMDTPLCVFSLFSWGSPEHYICKSMLLLFSFCVLLP